MAELVQQCDQELTQVASAIVSPPSHTVRPIEAAARVEPGPSQLLSELEDLLAEDNTRAGRVARECAGLLLSAM